jgi:hypothetical protein
MAHQLVFWKQAPGNPPDAHAVYVELMREEAVAGLDTLPGDRFLARVAEEFATGWERIDERAWEGDGLFQIETGPQHVLVICHSVTEETMNRLIDIGLELGCRLYDPQIKWRFEF